MDNSKAFILVGHSDWGKSTTFEKLVGQKRSLSIKDQKIPLRRMSNDDIYEGVLKYVENFIKKGESKIIFALCPDFKKAKKGTSVILKKAKANYECFFFVLKYRPDRKEQISDEEIKKLKEFGKYDICNSVDKTERATKFRKFIEDNL